MVTLKYISDTGYTWQEQYDNPQQAMNDIARKLAVHGDLIRVEKLDVATFKWRKVWSK